MGHVYPLVGWEMDRHANHDPTEALIAALSGELQEPEPEPDPLDWTQQRHELDALIARLPPIEQDVLDLHRRGVKQADAATLLGVTQAAVSHRLNKARERLTFMRRFPNRTEAEMQRDLDGVIDDFHIRVFAEMSRLSSQSHVGKRLGCSQGRVRHNMQKICERLRILVIEEGDAELADYLTMATMLTQKRWRNILLCQPGAGGYKGTEPSYCSPPILPANDTGLQGLDAQASNNLSG